MGKSLRVAYGEALVKLGQKNDRIVALDADLAHATMSATFAEAFPDRFFNAGIAECNMMGMAAGFAHTGYIPFASTFALSGTGRAYEIIRNSIAYTNTNVKFGLSHSGLSVGRGMEEVISLSRMLLYERDAEHDNLCTMKSYRDGESCICSSRD